MFDVDKRINFLHSAGLYEDQVIGLADGGSFAWQYFFLSVLVWIPLVLLLKHLVTMGGLALFCGNDVDLNDVRLPDKYPIEKQQGYCEQWTLTLADATEKEIGDFLEFRGFSRDAGYNTCAKEAVKYKGEIFDEMFIRFYYEKFALKKASPYATPQKVWGGWSTWWSEIGPAMKSVSGGSIMALWHHCFVGALAGYCLFVTPDPVVFNLVLYFEIGFNVLDIILFCLSMSQTVKNDYTIFFGPRTKGLLNEADYSPSKEMYGIHKLLLHHHIGATSLEIVGLILGCDISLCARLAFNMLGPAAIAHNISFLSDYTPIRARPYLWTSLSMMVLVTLGITRALDFIPLSYEIISMAYEKGGIIASIISFSILAFFTQVNIDFFRLYMNKTKQGLRAIRLYNKQKQL